FLIIGSLFAINFVTAMDTSATATIMPDVLSTYNSMTMYGALTSVTYLLVAGLRPIFAKIADTFGRVHAIVISIAFHTIGFVTCASARNFDYIFGGTILSTIGQAGYGTISIILIADFIPLHLRGSYNGYMAIPSVTNAYLGPVVAQALIHQWRWVYGLLAILALVCSVPAIYSLCIVDKRARENLDILDDPFLPQSIFKSLKNMAIELDLFGLLLLCGGVIMVLLPLGLSYNIVYGWSDRRVLGPLVSGVLVLGFFCLYEHKLARCPVVPFRLFKNRTFSAAMGAGTMFYFTSNVSLFFFNAFIQVTRDTDARTAQLLQLGSVVYYIGAILGGWAMQKSKRYRRWAWLGWAIYLISVGLMIRTRGGTHTSNGEIAAVQGLLGLGSGITISCIGIGVQASVDQVDIAIAIALYSMVAYLGGAIGEAVSTTIWNTVLPNKL
ncbi:major facilitator superfamily MFS-1, partial [Basidiobolus meristosporus CBS 931.73]